MPLGVVFVLSVVFVLTRAVAQVDWPERQSVFDHNGFGQMLDVYALEVRSRPGLLMD